MNIEDRIAALEQKAAKDGILCLGTPGTTIQRVLCAVSILDRERVSIPPEARIHPDGWPRESILVWTLGIGGLQQPKLWYYGHTIEAAITAAERGVEATLKAYKRSTEAEAPKPRKRRPK